MIYNAHYYTLQSAMPIVDTIVNAYYAHYILQCISTVKICILLQSIMFNNGYYCIYTTLMLCTTVSKII